MNPREIDALVAHHVYGWHRYDDPNGEFLPHQGWDAPEANRGVLPEFSTDPAASKQLRDKMRADGWVVEIVNRIDGTTWCWIHRDDGGEEDARTISATSAESECMAVALESLAAVGKPVAL